MKSSIKEQIEGYRETLHEIAVLRKYAPETPRYRGQVKNTIERYHPREILTSVSAILRETESTATLRLVAENGQLPPFQAGQYVNIFVDVDGIRTSRPYSISSPPNQLGYYDITIRSVQDGFVSNHFLQSIKPGDRLVTTGPTGNFYYNPLFHGDDLVFIAGGSGITPFMSMIREVTDRGLKRKIHLIYGSRVESDIVFETELKDRAERYANLTVTHVVSEPAGQYGGISGFITRDVIKSVVEGMNTKMFYVCGPEAMYSFVLKELEALDIPRRRIRVEVFGAPADITRQPGWPEAVKATDRFEVRVNGDGPFEARAGEPLMNSLERSGIVLPAACRSGECSLCRTKLLAGTVFHPPTVKIRKSDRKYGYIHPCMSYPLQNLELLI